MVEVRVLLDAHKIYNGDDMKLKRHKIKKFHEGDVYLFVNGVAKVPNMYYGRGASRKQATVSLKEFNSITK